MRTSDPETVSILVAGKDGVRNVPVEAFATSNPFFYVHPSVYVTKLNPLGGCVEWWTVTHQPTGAAVVSALPSRQVAELVALWYAAQSIDWSSNDVATARNQRSLKVVAITRQLKAAGEDYLNAVAEMLEAIDSPLANVGVEWVDGNAEVAH